MDFALNLKGKHFIAGTIEVYKVANIRIGQVIFTYYLILLPGKYRCRLTYIFFAIVTENCAKSTDSFTKSYFFSQRSLYLRKHFKSETSKQLFFNTGLCYNHAIYDYSCVRVLPFPSLRANVHG